jgi:Zn-finger nucleic acid-binding protein
LLGSAIERMPRTPAPRPSSARADGSKDDYNEHGYRQRYGKKRRVRSLLEELFDD